MSGAIERATNTLRVNLPSELDNTDPFVLDTMTIRVPTKIIGRTVRAAAAPPDPPLVFAHFLVLPAPATFPGSVSKVAIIFLSFPLTKRHRAETLPSQISKAHKITKSSFLSRDKNLLACDQVAPDESQVDYNKPDLDQEALEGMEAVAEEMRGNKPVRGRSTLNPSHCTLHTAHCTLHTAHCTPSNNCVTIGQCVSNPPFRPTPTSVPDLKSINLSP